MRSRAAMAAPLVAILAMVPSASEAQVYKCRVGGSTTYQAMPCANAPNMAPHIAAPAAGSVSGANVATPDLHGNLASLRMGLEAAAADERELLAQYRRESDALRNKMTTASSAEAVRAQQALPEEWAPRIRAAQVRQQQFRQEIMRRCPGGVKLDAPETTCKP